MPPAAPPRVLLAGIDDATTAVLQAELDGQAAIGHFRAGDAAPPGNTPTLLVVGAGVSAAAGLIGAVQSRTRQLAVIVVTDPARTEDTAALALLAPPERLAHVPAGQVRLLVRTARTLLDRLAIQHAYHAAQAAAQRRLLAGSEQARQPGEQLFGPLYHQLLIGAVALDAADRIIAWNRKAAEVLALRPDAAQRCFLLLFPQPVRAELHEHLARAALLPRPPALFERHRDDGTTQILRMSAQSVVIPDGTAHTLVVLEDVTGTTETRRQLAERTSHALMSADVSAAMTTSGPLRDRLHRSAQAIVDRLGVALVRIWILEPWEDTLVLQASAGLSGRLDDAQVRVGVGEGEIGVIAAERKPRLSDSMPADPGTDARQGDGEDTDAFAGYPLIADGDLLGVLAVHASRPLAGTTYEALAGIADQVAVGVRQDRLLNRLSATARALQAPLLPPELPPIPGLDIAARYRAQGDGLDVGGDFYDVFPLADGQWALALGDVCGKGPAAAAVTGLVRHTLWTAAQQDPDPAHVLPLVHRALRRENSPFCTLVYAVLDVSAGCVGLRVACAGHPAPLLRRRNGETRLVDEHGPLLGAFDLTDQPVQTATLDPGDSLVLYTDGFTEGAGAHLTREPEDLAALVRSWAGPRGDRPADELADLLFTDAVTRWAGRLRDDLAVIAVTAQG